MSSKWRPAKCDLEKGVRGLTLEDVAEDTKTVSCRISQPSGAEEPIVMPIYMSTTYKIPSVDYYLKMLEMGGNIYVRLGNPTCKAVEAAVNALEGGAGVLSVSSGMAAITTTLLALLKAGDHVISCNPLYSGTHNFLEKHLTRYNIEVSFTKGWDIDDYRKLIKPNTKLLYGETPVNPMITVMDLEAFGKLSQEHGLISMIDSTYATPYLQKPHKYGIDIVIHSATKYLGGHSDVLAGVISARTEELWGEIQSWRTELGCVLSPHDAALLSRGIKTLAVRMDRHCHNAQKVAEYLAGHEKIAKVHYPGLPDHPNHELAKRQMTGFGGMVSFEVKGGLIPAKNLVENVRLIILAVSLGGTESLIEHPATMTHGPMLMSDEYRRESFITDGLIRLSVGLENSQDLINDLEYALSKA